MSVLGVLARGRFYDEGLLSQRGTSQRGRTLLVAIHGANGGFWLGSGTTNMRSLTHMFRARGVYRRRHGTCLWRRRE